MITPRAKKEIYTGEWFPFGQNPRIYVEGELQEKVFRVLELFLASSGIKPERSRDCADAGILFALDESLKDREEHYRLDIDESGIRMSFADFLGGRNAVAALMQLIRRENERFYVLGVSIDDWPDNRMRGVMLDPARRFVTIQELKDTMLRMALSRMNLLHLHLMDDQGYAFESKAYPALNHEEHGFYRASEMKELVAYGQSIGIDILPEIEFVTHGVNQLHSLPIMQCETEHTTPSNWAMCIGKEVVYEIYEKLIQEITAVFPYPILHIGADEIVLYDIDLWPSWYDCKHCRKLAEGLKIPMDSYEAVCQNQQDGTFVSKGIRGYEELYIHAIRRMYDIVTKAGKRMMMWNDNINIGKPCDLPRDILIHFWRVAAEYRGPREGCSMEAFLDAGFEVVNSHYPETYIEEDIYKPEIPLNTWAPKVYPPSKEKDKDKILGGWPAAWGNYRHFAYSLPGALAFYADRLWDASPGVYGKQFCLSATRLMLGDKVPDGFDVFAALGGYILPKDAERVCKLEDCRRGYVDKVTISKEEVAETAQILKRIACDRTAEGRLSAIYAECADWVHERMAEKD